MRVVTLVSLVLVLTGLSAAQTIVSGYAAEVSTYGMYAAPFEPRITTPSVSLGTVAPSPVGASNATFGNVAGARNATLSIVAPVSVDAYTPIIPNDTFDLPAPAVSARPQVRKTQLGSMIDLGAASTPGVRQLMASSGPARKASRTFSNQDVDRVIQNTDQNTGTVKYGGKTEHVN